MFSINAFSELCRVALGLIYDNLMTNLREAPMKSITVEDRHINHNNKSEARKMGLVPGVVYANGFGNHPIFVNPKIVQGLLQEDPHQQFQLESENTQLSGCKVKVQAQAKHPITGALLHVDLLVVKD